jgi:hypothetical protein
MSRMSMLGWCASTERRLQKPLQSALAACCIAHLCLALAMADTDGMAFASLVSFGFCVTAVVAPCAGNGRLGQSQGVSGQGRLHAG